MGRCVGRWVVRWVRKKVGSLVCRLEGKWVDMYLGM